MDVEISRFDPASATETELADSYAVFKASAALDNPGQKFPALPEFIEQSRVPGSAFGPASRWVAREDGRIIGQALAAFPEHENRHLTVVRVTVAPERRRRGVGTALLRAMLPDLGAGGRTVVFGHSIKAGASGEAWALELGFVRTHGYVRQDLRVAEVDRKLWDRPVADGFRLERWVGAAPEALLAEYARARTAIVDAPNGESALEFEDWTPERVRAHEADQRAQRWDSRVVVAVHEATGRVAALTELTTRAGLAGVAIQHDTAVAAEFRGRGLGLAVKGAMLRWLTAERPDVEQVLTQTAHDNVHMMRINHAVGYVTTSTSSELEAGIAGLAERLAR